MRSSRRGLTLLEILVSIALAGLLGTLALRALTDVHRYYRKISEQSREIGSATVALDRLERLTFGLPRQALNPGLTPAGRPMLVVQPLGTLTASGSAVYSSKRWVVEENTRGVWLWQIEGESATLGALPAFPPAPDRSRKSPLLDSGWRFQAEFRNGNFPLEIKVTPPTPGTRSLRRQIEGYL